MKSEPLSNHEIARRKFTKAARLLGEVCALTGKESLVVRVNRIEQGRPAAPLAEASHRATRAPEKPLPNPARGQRGTDGEPIYNAETLELQRRLLAAMPALRALSFANPVPQIWDIDQDVLHYGDCASERSPRGGDCDCGPVFLARISGRMFALQPDGAPEPYTAPELSPQIFGENEVDFFAGRAFSFTDRCLVSLLADSLESVTAGDGVTARFVEPPTESDIETRSIR